MSRSLKIFFSYPHDVHQELVERLKADLEARGHEVWFDGEKIKTGDDWRAKITRGIQDSDRGVAFLSKHSTRDPGVCLNEIAIGLNEKGGEDFWVSTLVEPLAEAQPPVSVTAVTWLQCLDMQGWQEQDPGWYRARFEQLARSIENPADATRDADIERLRRVLRPLAFAHELGRHVGGFVGRQWVFDEIDAWLDGDRRSRVYRIEGGPGLGKTALALNLTHRARSRVIAVHLCRFNQDDSKRAASMVTNLAYQLATRLPDYRARLLRQPMFADLERGDLSAIGSDAAGSLWRELIAGPLAGQMPRQRLAIVIDALDEAHDSGQNEIVALLAQGLEHLPAWVGVVLTDRPDPDVVHRLARYRPTVLSADDPRNRADLKQYVDAWLAPLVERGELDASQRQAAEARLVERSDGTFLYLRAVREAVELGDCSLKDPDRLPHTLSDTYTLFFERRFGAAPSEPQGRWRGLVRPMLELVLASSEPLPLTLARRLLGWDDDAEADTLRALGSLFPRQAGRIAPFHNSVREWLEDGDKAGAFRVNPKPARTKLAKVLWAEHADETPEHPEADYARAVLPELLPRLDKTGREQVLGVPTTETAKRLFATAEAQAPRLKYRQAEGMWRIHAEIAEALVQGNPENTGFAHDLSVSSKHLGDTLTILGRIDEAFDSYTRSLSICEDLAAQAPESAQFARELSISVNKLGNTLTTLGRTDEALDYYRRGLEIREGLATHDPESAKYACDLSNSFAYLGTTLTALGRIDEALDFNRRGLSILEDLAARDPDNEEIVRDLSLSFNRLGTLLIRVDRIDEALDYHRRRLKIAEDLAARAPESVKFARDLSSGFSVLGDTLRILGRLDEAFDYYLRSLSIREDFAARSPESAEFAYDLSIGLSKLGHTLLIRGHLNEALSFYRKGLNIIVDLVARTPESAQFEHFLSIMFDNLGNTLTRLGLIDEALDNYKRGLEISETRALRAPENADYAGSLGLNLAAVGRMQGDNGNFRDRQIAVLRALAIIGTFANRPHFGFLLGEAGWTSAALGEFAEARELLGQSLAFSRKAGDVVACSWRLLGLAEIEWLEGRDNHAAALAEQSLTGARTQRDRDLLVNALLHFGRTRHALGELAAAADTYIQVLDLGVPDTVGESAMLLGVLRREQDRIGDSDALLERALADCEDLLEKSPRRHAPSYLQSLSSLGLGHVAAGLSSLAQAIQGCAAPGILLRAIRHLNLIERAMPATAGVAKARAMLIAAGQFRA